MSVSTALRARPPVVLLALAQQAPILLAVVLPPAIAAVATGEWAIARSLGVQIFVLITITSIYRDRMFPSDLRRVEAMVTFALMFIVASLLVIPPLIALGMPPVDALFEAVSGITSTGLSVAAEAEAWPIAGHLLRGWMQWCGGFAIAFAGLAIFTGTSGASLSMGSSTLVDRDTKSSMKIQARNVLVCYAGLTAVALASCLAVLPTWWEAVSIALAAVSTGGFSPRADSLASYTPLAQGVVIAICISAAVSLLFYLQVWRSGWRATVRKSHALHTIALMAAATAIYVAVAYLVDDSSLGSLYAGALNFLSGFTTAGFSTSVVSGHVSLLPLLLIAMLIGGDVGSTAGGIKVGRLFILLRMVRLTILRVRVPPSAVTYLSDGGARVESDRVIAVAALLVSYLVTMLIGWMIFLASDVPALSGLFEIISAISTVGLSQGVTHADMAVHLKLTLVVLMMLGRLEFIALFVLCLPGTWMRRSG